MSLSLLRCHVYYQEKLAEMFIIKILILIKIISIDILYFLCCNKLYIFFQRHQRYNEYNINFYLFERHYEYNIFLDKFVYEYN